MINSQPSVLNCPTLKYIIVDINQGVESKTFLVLLNNEADRTLLNSPLNMSIKLILCTLIATLTVTWVDQLFISLVFHVH